MNTNDVMTPLEVARTVARMINDGSLVLTVGPSPDDDLVVLSVYEVNEAGKSFIAIDLECAGDA